MKEGVSVPCGSCHLCCIKHEIVLFPDEGDDLSSYDYEMKTIAGVTVPVLKHKPNGDCIYLEGGKCSIHGRAPVICRVFDCRGLYRMYTRAERRRMVRSGLASEDILEAGRQRASTLPE